MATETDLGARLDRVEQGFGKIEKALETIATRPAGGGVTPNNMFGGFEQSRSEDWPVEKLKALGPSYSQALSFDYFRGRQSSHTKKLTGIGPALVALADSMGHPTQYGGAFRDTEKLEKEFGLTTTEKAARVGVKQLNGEVRKTALAEGSGQTGGYIIPPQFMNELLTIAAEDAFIEPRAKVIPMNSRTAQWPMLDITTVQSTGTTPYYGGILAQWQPEASQINETEPAFKQSEWVAWDLVMYTVSSNQLLADNGIGLDALLTQLFGQALTWYKEYAYLNGQGAGSSMPLGILNAPATYASSKTTSGGHFVFQDAATMMSHLQIRSWDDACWIMHQSMLPDLVQMAALSTSNATLGNQTAGNLAWLPPFGTDSKGPAGSKLPRVFLNGLPIFFTEKLPKQASGASGKGSVCLVDWSKYVIGMRLDMQIDVSPHFLFRNNQMAWRVIARVDGKPWLNNQITDAQGFKLSPFVIFDPT